VDGERIYHKEIYLHQIRRRAEGSWCGDIRWHWQRSVASERQDVQLRVGMKEEVEIRKLAERLTSSESFVSAIDGR
jgi:hypothetical protein